jgi:hypothetical protein
MFRDGPLTSPVIPPDRSRQRHQGRILVPVRRALDQATGGGTSGQLTTVTPVPGPTVDQMFPGTPSTFNDPNATAGNARAPLSSLSIHRRW